MFRKHDRSSRKSSNGGGSQSFGGALAASVGLQRITSQVLSAIYFSVKGVYLQSIKERAVAWDNKSCAIPLSAATFP